MSTYKKFTLNEQACTYIQDCLRRNRKGLSQRLLKLLAQAQGQVTTYLPHNVNPKKILEMKYGGISSGQQTLSYLTAKIQHFLMANPNHVIIIEDSMARKEDAGIASITLPMVFYGSTVYYFLSNKHCHDLDIIRRTISTLDLWFVIGAMTTLERENEILREKQEITSNDLDGFATRAKGIIIDAYDGEGYLIWSRM